MLCLSSKDIDKLIINDNLKLTKTTNDKGEVSKTGVVLTLKQLFQHFERFTPEEKNLEKINSAIASANYYREIGNRRFLGLSPQKEIINKKISHRYNNGDDIATEFYNSKKELYELIKNVTEYIYTLKDFLNIEDPELLIEDFTNNKVSLESIKEKICSEDFSALIDKIEKLHSTLDEGYEHFEEGTVGTPHQEVELDLKYILNNFDEEFKDIDTKELKKLKRRVKETFDDPEKNILVEGEYFFPSDLIKSIDDELRKRK